MRYADSKYISPLDRELLIKKAEIMFFEYDHSYKEIAGAVDVCQHTVGRWARQRGWVKRKEEMRAEGHKEPVSGFIEGIIHTGVYIRREDPDCYKLLAPKIEKLLNNHLNRK